MGEPFYVKIFQFLAHSRDLINVNTTAAALFFPLQGWGGAELVLWVRGYCTITKGKGHVDLFLGKFSCHAGQLPIWITMAL